MNVRAVRRSLAKQIFAAYLKQAGEGDHPDALTRRWAATAVEAAEPLVTRLLSLDALSKLFGEGSLNTALPNMPPQTVVPSPSKTDAPVRAASGLRMGLASLTWPRILTSVETRGFRTFHLTLPRAPGHCRARPALLSAQFLDVAPEWDRAAGSPRATARGRVAQKAGQAVR